MFEWVFDLPMLVAGPAIVAIFILFAVIGLRPNSYQLVYDQLMKEPPGKPENIK